MRPAFLCSSNLRNSTADFAADGFWQVLDELDLAWILVGRRNPLDVLLKFMCECVAGPITKLFSAALDPPKPSWSSCHYAGTVNVTIKGGVRERGHGPPHHRIDNSQAGKVLTVKSPIARAETMSTD